MLIFLCLSRRPKDNKHPLNVTILITFKYYCIPDFDLDDADTCRAAIRMFLQCNLVQQFHIPYDVSFSGFLSLILQYLLLRAFGCVRVFVCLC